MSYPSPRRLQLRRGNASAISSYLGYAGELVVDTSNWTLYVHDGITVGGYAATVNTASITGNISSILNGTAVFGNIIPSANVTYSLGNITHQWKDLFVSNTTIYIGGVPVSISASGNLTVNGNTIPTVAYVNTQIANVQVDLSSYALNANVTSANVGLKGYVDSQSFYSNAKVATYLTTGPVSISNVTISDNYGSLWRFTDSELQLPSGNGSPYGRGPRISSGAGIQIYPPDDGDFMIQTYATGMGGSRQYTFTKLGNIELSDGGNIVSDYDIGVFTDANVIIGNPFGTWTFKPDGTLVTPGEISFYNTTVQSDTAQNFIDLNSSNSILVKTNTGNLSILVDFSNGPYNWVFNNSGNIQFPDTSQQRTAWTGTIDYSQITNAYSNVNVNAYANLSTYAYSANVTAANVGMKGYVDNAVSTIVIPVTYSNVNVAAYLTTNNYLTNTTANLANYAWNANIVGAGTNYSNVNVKAYTETMGFKNYSNVNVAAYLATASITTTGNITAAYLLGNISITGNVTGTQPNVTIQAGAYTSVFDNQGNVTVPQLFAAGNIQTSGYLFGNGAFLTGIVSGGSSYGNTEVITFLNSVAQLRIGQLDPTYSYIDLGNDNVTLNACTAVAVTTTIGSISLTSGSGNVYVSAGNITTPGIKTNNYYYANGTAVSFGSTYSNVQVATYLPTYTGNIANVRLGISGVLTFADGTTLATASAIGGSNYSNANVASYLITNQYINANSAYSNANVTSYLPTHSGNVGVNNLIGTTPNVTLVANSYSTTFDIYGNVAFGNVAYPVQIFVTGDVSAANVSTGSVSAGNVTVPGTSGKIGFSSGGFVQQATSNSTQVTSHTTSGNIQLMNINLGTNGLHTVAFGCNKLSTNDIILINHISGGTTTVYVDAYVVSDGLALIWMRNISGQDSGNFTPMLKYAIVRAPSA